MEKLCKLLALLKNAHGNVRDAIVNEIHCLLIDSPDLLEDLDCAIGMWNEVHGET